MLVILTVLVTVVYSRKTLNDLIYTSINFDGILCFRMNNYNSQAGCQTNRDGDNGILYPFDSDETLSDTLQSSLSSPIIAVINASLFTNRTVEQLIDFPLTKGLIVLEENVTASGPFSPEKPCPGNGFNYNETVVEKKKCLSKKLWNPDGNWLSHLDIPFGIFIIKNDTQKEVIINKTNDNIIKGSLKKYPLWGAEMRAFMNSALDTETCMRRGTCDPVTGLNLVVNIIPRQDNSKPIVLFIVKADATAFFKDLSYGGEASGGSIVALLGVIKALAQVRDNDLDPKNNFTSPDFTAEFMVTFLQAESFDYSGSQRLAYNLKNKQFGQESYNISMDDVKCIIELGPLSLSNELNLHTLKPDDTVEKIQGLFSKYNQDGALLSFVNSSGLPPSSLNSFLREDDTVSGVLITDSDSQLMSHVYGSRYDITQLPSSPDLSGRIKMLVGIIANVSLELAGGAPSVHTEIEDKVVDDLLECILVNQNCTLLQSILNRTDLENERLSRYTSVGQHTSNYTTYLNYLSKEFSQKVINLTEENCNSTYSEGWQVTFKNGTNNGTCYGTVVNTTSAKSPAFVLNQHDSSVYSTWTESRWSPKFMLRVFLVASLSDNIALCCCGLLYFIVMSGAIFQCHRRRDLIFPSESE